MGRTLYHRQKIMAMMNQIYISYCNLNYSIQLALIRLKRFHKVKRQIENSTIGICLHPHPHIKFNYWGFPFEFFLKTLIIRRLVVKLNYVRS